MTFLRVKRMKMNNMFSHQYVLIMLTMVNISELPVDDG